MLCIISFVCCINLNNTDIALAASSPISEGEGTQENPYVISSSENLLYMAEQINAGTSGYSTAYYKQTANIDMSSVSWTPIESFAGNYDGQGYMIKNLNGEGSNYDDVYKSDNINAFSFIISLSGHIKNLGISCSISVTIKNHVHRAPFCISLLSSGIIENCFSTGSISTMTELWYPTKDSMVGGIASVSNGTIRNCYSNCTLSADAESGAGSGNIRVGGIVATIQSGLVENCLFVGSGNVNNNGYWKIGGIIGYPNGGTIKNSAVLSNSCKKNNSVVNDFYNYENKNSSDATIENCYVLTAEQLKSSETNPLSLWEWNKINNFPRTWGFVENSSSEFYNNGYPQLRVFYENFNINFYSEDGTELITTKTTRYPDYYVNFQNVSPQNKKGHTFNGEFTTLPNSSGEKLNTELSAICADINLYATYDVNFYNLKITTSNGLAGDMTIREESVAYNTQITAVVNSVNIGYQFLEWRNLNDNTTLSNDLQYTFNMPDYDLSIYSYFAQETYFVKVVINDIERGNISGIYDYYTVGQNIELSAVANDGYKLDKYYTKDGTILSSDSNYSFIMPRNNLTIYVDFVERKYTLTILSYPEGLCSVTGGGNYYLDEEITLSFSNIDSNYKFAYWKIDDYNKSTPDYIDENIIYTMPANDTTIYCCLLPIDTIVVNFVGLNNVISSHTINYGDTVSPPTPEIVENYNFIGWFSARENGIEISSFENITESITAYACYERLFNCFISLDSEILNTTDFEIDPNITIFISLRSPSNKLYTFALNSNLNRTLKLEEFGEYKISYVLPTYYTTTLYLNDVKINNTNIEVDLYDEFINIKFMITKQENKLLYDSSLHFSQTNESASIITPNISTSDEEIYNGVDSVLSSNFPSLNSSIIPKSPYNYEIKDVIGATNWGGLYNFTNLDYLTEGAEFVGKDLGSTVYKCSFANHYQSMYPFNQDWGNKSINTMTDLAQTPAYENLFGLDTIQTYILVAYEFVYCPWERVITNGYTMETMEIYYEHVRQEFEELTIHLLTTYSNTNKIFILSNWEGDNAYGAYFDMCTTDEQKQLLTDAYVGYINARQDGIISGRNQVISTSAKVYGNFEVCHIGQNIPYVPNRWRLVDVAVPYTYCDLYSFSDWYTYLKDENENYIFPLETMLDSLYNAALNNLCHKYPDQYYLNPDFNGRKNIMVTEFGYDENTDPEFNSKIVTEIEKAINWGVYKITYWGVYSNVRLTSGTERPRNEEMQGLWLIRPDGTFTYAFWHIKSIISGIDYITNPPQIVFKANESLGVDFDSNHNKIIFKDDLTDTSLMIDHSLTTLEDVENGRISFYNIDPNSDNYKYFEEFNKFFNSIDLTGIIQTKDDKNHTYITYEMKSNKFGILLYNYNDYNNYVYLDYSKLKNLITLEGKSSEGEWEVIENIKVEQYQAQNRSDGDLYWFQTYISATTDVGKYSELRISFTNKEYNAWDPILTSVFFYEGGVA